MVLLKMGRSCISFIFAIVPLFLNGQIYQDFKVERSGDVDIYSDFSEKTQSTNYFIHSKSKIHSLRLNAQLEMVKEQIHDRKLNDRELFQKYLGATKSRGKYHFFYIDVNYQDIGYTTMDSSSFYGEDGRLLNLNLSDELIIDCFDRKDEMYILTIVKKSALLKLYNFKNPQNWTVKEFDFRSFEHAGELYEQIESHGYHAKLPERGREVLVSKIMENEDVSVFEAIDKIKFFKAADDLFLTFDHQELSTWVLRISMKDDSFEAKKIAFESACEKFSNQQPWHDSNSFIHNDQIFSLSFCDYALSLKIFNVFTEELLKETRVGMESPLNFSTSPLYYYKIRKNIELKDTEQFFKKSRKKKVGVSVYEVNDKLVLKVDAYSSLSTPNSAQIHQTYFYILLDKKSLEKIDGDSIPMHNLNFISNYEWSWKANFSNRVITEYKNKIYHSCFLPFKNILRVSLLEKPSEPQ